VVEAGFKFCPNCGQGLDAPAAAEARPAASIPEPLAEKIRGAAQSVGERKQVTVLFCDLAGSTAVANGLDPEVYRELLDQYVALALHEVYRYDGIVNQLSGDGFMALFGAPIAHEDAPQRAVWAGLAIRDALAHFNHQLESERGISLPARIGINTGSVVVGTVGNDLKMDYTAIGDTTNLAARLESLADPGTILISEPTARLVRGFFELRQVGPLVVKGKPEPVAAFEVVTARPHSSPMAVAAERGLTPLVGRSEELAQLDACYRRLGGHLTQVVSVVGEAGSGKSRLIYEFKQRLLEEPEPVVLFEGRCGALSQTVPLAPFVAMLRQYFGIDGAESTDASCAKVQRRLGAASGEIDDAFPLLCRVLSVEAELPADLPLDALKQETFQAVGKLIQAESKRAPVVMILEDLHWIDESSQELLAMAMAKLMRARVMILVSHRSEYRTSWYTHAALTQLHLRPLLDDEVLRIARSLAGGVLPAELEVRLLAKAEGSPFFAEEITRSLSEEGYLSSDAEGAHLTRPVEEILIPGTVREVIAARLDRLRPSAKRVAQLAAVLGRQFHRRELTALLAPEEADVDQELAELSRRGVIHRKSLFTDDEFRFGESLTQEVAYDSLLLKQRRQLHERVARLLEVGGGDATLAGPALIAHHYALSDNRAKAVETLLSAALEAERLPSFRTAIALARQAWEISETALRDGGDLRAVMNAALAYTRLSVLYGVAHDPDAERAAVRGRELAAQLGDAATGSTLDAMYGMLLTTDPARFAEGVALAEAAIETARQAGNALQVVSASRAVAWHYMLDGRLSEARTKIDWVLQSLLEHEQSTLSDLFLSARFMRENVLYHSDDLETAAAAAAETYEMALRAPNRTVQSGASAVLSGVNFLRGRYADARQWAQRSFETAEAIGNIGALHRARAQTLAARTALGEAPSSGRLADAIEEGVGQGGNILLSIYHIVETFLALGDVRRAERVARLAVDQAAGRLREMLAAIALGEATTRLGPAHWGEAERAFERGLGLAAALNARGARTFGLIGRGRLALARNQPEDALRAWSEAREICLSLGFLRYQRQVEQLLVQVGATETGGAADHVPAAPAVS
ncbi:MAG: ATP-binding protein, partial [Candidatus Binatia bacterium]